MAQWISSKLKAAETLLQQIDQQASESLRKNEKRLPDDQLSGETTPRTLETKPLIKEQLKKKSAENLVYESVINIDKQNLKAISGSNSVISWDDGTGESPDLNSNMIGRFNDSDWTELLSVPDKKGVSGGGGSVSRSSNRVSGIRASKKYGKKVGNSDLGMNFSKSSGKSSIELENITSADSDESDKRNSGSLTFVSSNTNLANTGRAEDGDKVRPENDSDHSSRTMLISHENEVDMEMKSNNGERLKRESSAVKKVPSSPSDRESSSGTDTSPSSDSESEGEKEERRKRRQQILEERAAVKAVEAIIEHENLVARLEGEKQSIEKIFEEQAKQQVQEASDLQTTMMDTMDAVELEKQKHNNTRMEALARLAKLERANADLTRSLANVQKNLEAEVDRIAEFREQIHIREATHEELRRKISSTHHSDDKLRARKSVVFELEMLESEYSFINDKVGRIQDQAKTLETSIETTRIELESPTEVEIELKRRLHQLTDHLILKQAQVETLSSEKAMLLLRIEAVSRMMDEYKSIIDAAEFSGTSSRDDVESGTWKISNAKLRSIFRGRVQSGQRHLGSLVRQLDSLFCVGTMFLRRNSTARMWSVVYLACLHVWVMYILMSRSPVSDDTRSGAVFSLENINNTVF